MENLFMLLNSSHQDWADSFCDKTKGSGQILVFIGFLVQLLRWGIPVVLIIMGTIDVGKAVVEQDDKKQKAAYQKFLKRLMAAIVVFLIPSIAVLFLNIFITSASNTSFAVCADLVLPGITLPNTDAG